MNKNGLNKLIEELIKKRNKKQLKDSDLIEALKASRNFSIKEREEFIEALSNCLHQCRGDDTKKNSIFFEEILQLYQERNPDLSKIALSSYVKDWIIHRRRFKIPSTNNPCSYMLYYPDATPKDRIYRFKADLYEINLIIPTGITNNWTDKEKTVQCGISRSVLEYSQVLIHPDGWKPIQEFDPDLEYRLVKPPKNLPEHPLLLEPKLR